MLDVTAAEKPTAPKSITIKHLANELGEQHQLSKRQALKLMEDLISMLTKHLKQGERVKIVGLGILQVRNRAARTGPQSGDRRANSDQGQQKGGLPRFQRTQGRDLTASVLD